jgi:hypothetical protein
MRDRPSFTISAAEDQDRDATTLWLFRDVQRQPPEQWFHTEGGAAKGDDGTWLVDPETVRAAAVPY